MYVEGKVTGERLEGLRAHLDECEACRALVVAATYPAPDDAEVAGEHIVAGVIARTSGSVCGSAEARLPAFVKAELDADEAELVAMHLSTCAGCRDLAMILSWSPRVCREMAFVEPPPGFTAGVVRLTGAVRSPRVFVRRIRRAWLGAVTRPRFAVELAYAGALIAALLVGTPNAPLRPLLPETARLASTNLVEVVVAGAEAAGVVDAAVSAAHFTYEQTASRGFATARVVDDLSLHAGPLVKATTSGDIGAVAVQLDEVGDDLERLLQAIGRGVPSDPRSTHGEHEH